MSCIQTAQPRQDRSIKSSSHVANKPLSLRPLVPEAREAVARQVERLLGADWRISHRLVLSRDSTALGKDQFYAWQREGRERPGLLVLESSAAPAVFWDMDRDQPNALRFQTPFGFLRKGAWIFSATLLRGERRLILEDVFVADGVNLLRSASYSERWATLSAAYAAFTAQQLFLGFSLVLVEPRSLAALEAEGPQPGTIWDFQPDAAGKLRLYWICPGARVGPSAGAQARAAEALSHLKLPDPVNKNVLKRSVAVPTIRIALVSVDKTTSLPDSYMVSSACGTQLGRASVSKLEQSKALRAAFAAAGPGVAALPAEVVWHTGFNKYEVLRILPADTPAMDATAFYECAGDVSS